MKKSRPYYQLIPEKIYQELPAIENNFRNIPGYCLDNLKQIITLIVIHTRKEDDKYYGAALKMTYLRKIIPQADHYLTELISLAIIERFGTPIDGVSSYKYKFTEPYRSKCKLLQLNNPKLIRRFEKYQLTTKIKNSKKYPGQNRFLRELEIDPEALDYIKDIEDENRYNYYLSAITKILSGDIFISIDKTAGRLHSNVTNLPGNLRQFLRVYGKELVNLDVKNSQPYLSTMIFTNPRRVAEYVKYQPLITLLESLQIPDSVDIKRYMSLVFTGTIYEYLMEEFSKRGLIFESRDEIKRQFMIILFAKNSIQTPARKIFNEIFPTVSLVFNQIRGNEKEFDNTKNYKRFAILLQTIESDIILKQILSRINREHPEIITITIHDSIMTSDDPESIKVVRKILTEELEKQVGKKPMIKEERKEKEGEGGGEMGGGGGLLPC